MKKFILVLMSFTLLSSQAFANPGVKLAMDEFLYATEVEGLTQAEATINLRSQVEALNLSQAELLQDISAQIKNESQKQVFMQVLATIDAQKLSSDEAMDLMAMSMKNVSSHGASWSGDVTMILGGALLIIIFAVALTAGPSMCNDDAYYAEHQVQCDRVVDTADRYDSRHDWNF